MARIPAEELERLKAQTSVERLIEGAGVELKRAGKDLLGRCPFHEDREASLVVTPSKNLWHCFGCQIGGGPIDWLMKSRGVSFRHAVELLREGAIEVPAVRHSRGLRGWAPPVSLSADDQALLRQAIDYYHERLKQTPEALSYLSRRGLNHPEMIDAHRLGFADRTLGLRLPEKTRKAGNEIRGRLQKLGLWRASGHEHFNGSLVIPVISPSGEITEVYGRKITEGLRPGTPLHLYLPGPHRGVWNQQALEANKEVILCEALIDALTFWCAGYRNVTASYGIEGFTADHLAVLKACGAQRVLIAYDRDEAGDRAAEKLAAQLLAGGLDCYRILFPKGMDANAYALKLTPAAKSLGVVIRSAQWMGKGAAPCKGKPQTLPGSVEVVVPDAVHDPAPVIPLVAEEAAKEEIPIAAPVLPAQALPDPPAPIPPSETKAVGAERELVMNLGPRRYRVRGLEKNLSYEVLKVNLLAAAPALDGAGEAVHVDTLDLYHARARTAFVEQAAIELGVPAEAIKGDLGKLLLALEAEQERRITAALAPKTPLVASIDERSRARALEWLKAPDLIERIVADFNRCGIVGEGHNALVGYLAGISRKLERPLALLIQSTSAAGKSSLLDAILRFVPCEDRIVYSAMTGQSLYYMGEMDLKHKLLAIAEEQGASRASYALKLLQSEGELTIASTSKDVTTGKLETQAYRVEGPVMIALTTTAVEIDEELLNRCLVLTINENRAQTQAIHAAQRERRTLAGLNARTEREAIVKLHQDAQRLLEPLAVVNPYADRLTFLDDRTRTRRDHEKYLTLIDVIALLHQHQRPVHTTAVRSTAGAQPLRYIEVTLEDIALANALAHEVLGRTLDELPPQTRRLLGLIVEMVQEDCRAQQVPRAAHRFSRRVLRERIKWGDTQLKIHLGRLTELEYLLIHRGGRGQSFEYELLYDGPADGSHELGHLSGLINVEALRRMCGAQPYDGERSGCCTPQSGLGRSPVGVQPGAGRSEDLTAITEETAAKGETMPAEVKTHDTGNGAQSSSYVPLAAPCGVQTPCGAQRHA
jgi:DNA primase